MSKYKITYYITEFTRKGIPFHLPVTVVVELRKAMIHRWLTNNVPSGAECVTITKETTSAATTTQ